MGIRDKKGRPSLADPLFSLKKPEIKIEEGFLKLKCDTTLFVLTPGTPSAAMEASIVETSVVSFRSICPFESIIGFISRWTT